MAGDVTTVSTGADPSGPRSVLHTRAVPLTAAVRRRLRERTSLPRDVLVLGLIAFCVAVGFGVLVPVLPVFARSFGVDNFAVGAVVLKALIGFWLAHMLHHIPAKGQRKWRGMLLIPWVIPPALSTLGWWWMFDPSYSSINWVLSIFAVPAVPWLGEPLDTRYLDDDAGL